MPVATHGQCVKVVSNGVEFILRIKTVKKHDGGYSYTFVEPSNKRTSARLAQTTAGQHVHTQYLAVDCETGNAVRGGRRTKRSTRRSKRSRRAHTRRQ